MGTQFSGDLELCFLMSGPRATYIRITKTGLLHSFLLPPTPLSLLGKGLGICISAQMVV